MRGLAGKPKSGEQTFLIKKGNHSAEGNHFQMFEKTSLSYEVEFDSSAIYESALISNQEDVNKLFGFSDCNTHHHDNSARIGWVWNGKAIALYAYSYVNKERVIKPLINIQINEQVKCSISASGDKYYFKVNNYTDSLPRHCTDYEGSRYKLYPYFGGDEMAPHDVRIKMKDIEAF